jgi:hypothetical protein
MEKRVVTAIAEVDPAELAILMCEASYGLIRPVPGAREALDAMDNECRGGWLRAAKAATDYFVEIINSAKIPS